MRLTEKKIPLRDGRQALLRSLEPEDAPAMRDYLRITAGETPFLLREPDEVPPTLEEEQQYHAAILAHPVNFMLGAFVDGELAGTTSVRRVIERRKCAHRGTLGICLYKAFWGLGLGTAMMEAALAAAWEAGFEQVELEVYADNVRAIQLYEKMGFQAVGTLPNAYRLSDKTYRNEVKMVRFGVKAVALSDKEPPQKQRFCVIGDPVSHSKSPMIHNTMLKTLHLDAEYLCQPVQSGELESFLASMRAGAWSGCNVTMPYKGAVIPHLDWVEEAALKCGAVNTICNKNGKLYGYSTDGGGFLGALAQAGVDPASKTVTLLGAGGAATSVAWALAQAGVKTLFCANRTLSKAEELCQLSPAVMEPYPFDTETLCKLAAQSDLLINATSLGMGGVAGQFADFGFLDALPPEAVVFDLIYHPAQTELLRRARERGLAAHNGLGLLVHQAILALEHFTDTKIDPAAVLPAVHAALAQAGIG